MATRLLISLESTDYVIYDDVVRLPRRLTDRETAIILSLFLIANYRQVWEELTDVEWDTLSDDLARIENRLLGS